MSDVTSMLNAMSLRLFTSESVTEGHPDKVCDQVSDAILDEMLRQDPLSRVAVETMVTTGLVHVAGEVTTEAYVDIPSTIRGVVRDIGYTSSSVGFDADSCGVSVSIGEQSPDIWLGWATRPIRMARSWALATKASCSDMPVRTPPS